MKQTMFFTRIMITVAVIVLGISCAFAAEEVVLIGQAAGITDFAQDNVSIINDIALWQTDSVKKKATGQGSLLKLIKTDRGKFYMEVDGLGRAEVKLLKLVYDGIRVKETAAIEKGNSVYIEDGKKYEILDTPRNKNKQRLEKGERIVLCYDDTDKIYRMIGFDDTWQLPVRIKE